MRVIPIAVLIVVVPFEAFLCAQATPPGGTVEGTVLNGVTGAGIGDAYIEVSANRFASGYHTTSDVAGHFRDHRPSFGKLSHRCKEGGFRPCTPDGSFFLKSELHVSSGGDPVKAELKLTPFGTLSGRVLDPDGKPVAGVRVSVYQLMMANTPVTDVAGRFAIENMSPGAYTLVARPPQSAQPQKTSDGLRPAMVTTYYPSVVDLSLAQQIVFRGEGDADYEIRMQTAPVHRVRGFVLDEQGKPSPGAELELFRISDSSPYAKGVWNGSAGSALFTLDMRPRVSGREAAVVSGKDGRFEFLAVSSGEWIINAAEDPTHGTQPDGRISSHATTNALVTQSDVDDLPIHLIAPFKLDPLVLWQEPANQQSSNPRPRTAPVFLMHTDSNELIEVTGRMYLFPDVYKVVAEPGFSAQAFLGESEVTGQPFSLAASGPALRVLVKTRSGIVRGTVQKGNGATIVLMPNRPEPGAVGQTIACGSGGSFELNEVSPGDYYIAAFDRTEGRSPSATTLGLVSLRGTKIKVEEGLVVNVMIAVISIPQ